MKPQTRTLSAISVALLCLAVCATLFATACPTSNKDAARSAVEASYRLPAATNDLIAKVAAARDSGVITTEQARNFGTHLNELARAEVVFVQMVKVAADPKTPKTPEQFARVRDYFDASIIEPFLHVLEISKLISAGDATLVTTGVIAVRLLLRTIASGIGSRSNNALAGPGGMAYIDDSGGQRAAFA